MGCPSVSAPLHTATTVRKWISALIRHSVISCIVAQIMQKTQPGTSVDVCLFKRLVLNKRKLQVLTCKCKTSIKNRMWKTQMLPSCWSCVKLFIVKNQVVGFAMLFMLLTRAHKNVVRIKLFLPAVLTTSVYVSTGCLLGPGPDLREVPPRLLQPWPGKSPCSMTSPCVECSETQEL